jgi:hypothetical protein
MSGQEREALEFYADPANWDHLRPTSLCSNDQGRRARAALAAREEPQGENDLEVSRLLLQVATERERAAQALAERDEALIERDEAEDYRATVSDDLVERVARAIFEAGRGPRRVRHGDGEAHKFSWERVPAEPKTGYRMQARAAIAEILGACEEPQSGELRSLDDSCAKCGAEPGEPCQVRPGESQVTPHRVAAREDTERPDGDSHWATVVIDGAFEPREITEAEAEQLYESGIGIDVERMWIRPGVRDTEQEHER